MPGVWENEFDVGITARERAAVLTVGSLFAGIGGFDLGFERAGFEIKWQVEIDPFCRAVLAQHWPNVRRYEDVRTVGSELERVDVLCGGFPCQDISVAGAGAGLDGARSGLWREFDRLVGELRPQYVVVENVAALLSRGLGRVLGDLAARGFDAEWDCLPASAFGAPHRRDRVWVVAYASRELAGQQERQRGRGVSSIATDNGAHRIVADSASVHEPYESTSYRNAVEPISAVSGASDSARGRRDAERGRRVEPAAIVEAMADAYGAGREQQRRIFPIRAELASIECRRWWITEPNVGRVAHGVPARVDRLRGLGNAVVPQITEWIARRIVAVLP